MQNCAEVQRLTQNLQENALALKQSTDTARRSGLDAGLRVLPRFSDGELLSRRSSLRHIRAYMTQLVNNMRGAMVPDNSAYLLFDADGCLLRLKAQPEIESWLKRKSVVLGSAWRLEELGPNAVTLGLNDHRAYISVGKENYQELLKDTAIYYAPMELQYEGKLHRFGGVAIITASENAHTAYQMTAAAISSSLMLRLNMSWNLSDAYESDSRGVVLLDINLKNGISSITHHNKMFFDMFELPHESRTEIYFKNAEEYFDPLPLNKSFWSIVKEARQVENQEISISVRGKVFDRIISTVPSENRQLCATNILICITSRQQQAKQAAEKTGNNAIISFDNIVGSSLIMRSKIKRAKLLANTDSNIMLLGESGVGKDVFAQAIHNQSARWKGPFVAVNCGALPRDLIASELFGYDGGAFTGAKKQGNIGKFELANGGTLFLDEIGEMPLDLQATLLRAVEQKQFMRLGSSKVVHADVRILSATNVDITQMIQEKKFRADLYYRLCTMSLYLPPMRERGKDIILLAEYFIKEISAKTGRRDVMVLTEEAKEFLCACEWYGNVREMQNLIECLVQLYDEHEVTVEMIRENVNPAYFIGVEPEPEPEMPAPVYARQQAVPEKTAEERDSTPAIVRESTHNEAPETAGRASLTKEKILAALEETKGNRSKAAKLLGVGRRTLYRHIDQLGIGNK